MAACATAPTPAPAPDDADAAIAAARSLIGSLKPWAPQASYKAKRKGGRWLVIVNCRKCGLTRDDRVTAAYVVQVDRQHHARIVTGFEK